jgi:PAS domain S-box-containing protein
VAGGLVAAAVLFATAVKADYASGPELRGLLDAGDGAMGVALDFLSDLVPTLPALAGLLLFHGLPRLWPRLGAGVVLGTAVLTALVNFVPVREGIETRRRELVELAARERNESPSTERQILLQSTLDHLVQSTILQAILDESPRPEHANLAFVLWAHSPLVGDPAGCLLRLVDAEGEAVSTFSLGYPPELRRRRVNPASLPRGGYSRFRREDVGSERLDLYTRVVPLARGERVLGAVELSLAYWDDLQRPEGSGRRVGSVFSNLSATPEFLRFRRDVPDRVDRYRGEELVASTDPEGALGKRVRPTIVRALAEPGVAGRWESGKFGGKVYELYHVRERDGQETVGYLSFGIERHGWLHAISLLSRSALVTVVLAAGFVAFLMLFGWVVPGGRGHRLRLPTLGFRERVIGGFLLVSLLPTVLLGVAGRRLFIAEQRREFEERLLGDLEVTKAFLGRRLSDTARNVAASEEVTELIEDPGGRFRSLGTPASADGVVVMSGDGRVLGASRSADLDLALLGTALPDRGTPIEFFRRRGDQLYACALVPVAHLAEEGLPAGPPARVLAFERIDSLRSSELERRVGSPVSFFAGGRLVATSKPELYQSEILSDLVQPEAYRRIELEGWRRLLLETRVGTTSFLASYAPLFDEGGEPVGILATLEPFHGRGLDLEMSLVLSRIYFFCLLVFAGAIAAAVVLANRLTGPISELTAGAELIGAGRLGHRIRAKAPAEIGALVRSFNEMSTQLAESEARDRERREYIEAIIRHVASGVVSFDAAGRIATVNDAAARILGVETARAIGRTPREVEGGPAFDAVIAAVEPVLRGRRAEVVHEFEIDGTEEEGGESSTIRFVGTRLVDSDGRAQGAVAVFDDLTELIRSKKIKAWAEMARQVAHEIKNPLTPMKLSAQQLRAAWRDKHPKFDRILEESTETIVDRCEALRRIAVEFSDYARMPGRTIRREDLTGLLREAGRLYGETRERSVEFSMALPDTSLWTHIDKDEVMRLFINLFENSIQAMPEGGDLSVTACRKNGEAEVTIADSGQGISKANLGRIWEPSFSTKTGGAGLGLPICRAIMEDYGGRIRIESEEGRGTTVILGFPVEDGGGPGDRGGGGGAGG